MQNEWWIDYSGSNLHGCYYQPEGDTFPAGTEADPIVSNVVPSVDDNVIDLRMLRYGLFGNDYFTSAKPWLVRGEETKIDYDINVDDLVSALEVQGDANFANSYIYGGLDNAPTSTTPYMASRGVSPAVMGRMEVNNGDNDQTALESTRLFFQNFASQFKLAKVAGKSVKISSALSANTLRNLLAVSVWQERNTLSNGNYNRLIQSHWNHKPHAPEFEPIYIGGTTDMVSFGSVVQSSSSVSGSPLGSRAGQGSASGGSDVVDFVADDYGLIMGIMFISPEVAYHGGIDRHWTELTHDEQFQPEFANLGYQPILKQEICVSGVDSVDKDLFGYQTRYLYQNTSNRTTRL